MPITHQAVCPALMAPVGPLLVAFQTIQTNDQQLTACVNLCNFLSDIMSTKRSYKPSEVKETGVKIVKQTLLCLCIGERHHFSFLNDEYRLMAPVGMENYFLSFRCRMYMLAGCVFPLFHRARSRASLEPVLYISTAKKKKQLSIRKTRTRSLTGLEPRTVCVGSWGSIRVTDNNNYNIVVKIKYSTTCKSPALKIILGAQYVNKSKYCYYEWLSV